MWPFRKVETRAADLGTLAEPTPEMFSIFGAQPTRAGVLVTPETAMRVPTVFGCVRAISEAVGTIPLKLFRRLDNGGKESASNEPAYRLAHAAANGWTSAAAFRTQLTQDALLYGHGAAFVNRSPSTGKPVEFIRFKPRDVTVELNSVGEPEFKVAQGNAPAKVYSWKDVLYIPAASLDGVKGVAPIHLGREAIGLAMVLETKAAEIIGKADRPPGLLTTAEKLNAPTRTNIIAGWKDMLTGGGTPLLDNGVSYQTLPLKFTDAQFVELWQAQVLEICRLFRMPPTMVQDFGRATWANSYTANLQFLQFCLGPWLRTWEDAMARVLLSEAEQDDLFFEFIPDALLKTDPTARFEAYSKAISAGWLNPDEVRELENRPPRPGGDQYGNPFTTATPANDNAPTQEAANA